MASTGEHRRVTVAASHVDLDDPASRLLMPTAEQGPFLPFERFAETVATARVQVGLHPHVAEEVVTYVLDGYVRHQDGTGQHSSLYPGSVLVLTAHEEFRHELTMQPIQQGRSARWLSIVLRLPWHTEAPATSLRIRETGDAVETPDGTIQRPVVGSLARADTSMGLECTDIEFAKPGNELFRIGGGRRAVAYALAGSGKIEDEPVELGHGALLENVASVAMHGSPGYRVFLASVPVTGSRGGVYSADQGFQRTRSPRGKGR